MRVGLTSLMASLTAIPLLALTATSASASADKPVIALSNAYYGNTWRHQMVEAFEASAKEAKAAGKIADYVVLNGDGTVAQQNSQIAELILKGVDAIAVDAASETAVNGVIEKACKAGIKVVTFNSVASAPCNYQLNFDFKGYKKAEAEWVFKKLGGKGNVLQVRGVKGSAPDNDMFNAQAVGVEEISRHQGRCDRLRTGHGLGGAIGDRQRAAEPAACRCGARPGRQRRLRHRAGLRPVRRPLQGQAADHRGRRQHRFHQMVGCEERERLYDDLDEHDAGHRRRGVLARLALVKGAQPPKLMIMPVATVNQDNLKEFANLPSGMIVSPSYSEEWVKKNLLDKKDRRSDERSDRPAAVEQGGNRLSGREMTDRGYVCR